MSVCSLFTADSGSDGFASCRNCSASFVRNALYARGMIHPFSGWLGVYCGMVQSQYGMVTSGQRAWMVRSELQRFLRQERLVRAGDDPPFFGMARRVLRHGPVPVRHGHVGTEVLDGQIGTAALPSSGTPCTRGG